MTWRAVNRGKPIGSQAAVRALEKKVLSLSKSIWPSQVQLCSNFYKHLLNSRACDGAYHLPEVTSHAERSSVLTWGSPRAYTSAFPTFCGWINRSTKKLKRVAKRKMHLATGWNRTSPEACLFTDSVSLQRVKKSWTCEGAEGRVKTTSPALSSARRVAVSTLYSTTAL